MTCDPTAGSRCLVVDPFAPFATCTWSVLPTGETAYSVFWGDTGDYGRDGIVWAPE